tara:strand:+ start:41358 stop:41867 length:510 start_codon:yes stop_codon:yes gene_type:complete
MTEPTRVSYVLAIEPSSRGLCFAAFDEERNLLDWGGFEARLRKNQLCRQKARSLTRGFQPKYLVLEDGDAPTSTRKRRIRELLRTIGQDAADDGMTVSRIPRLWVRQRFTVFGISSKDDIATAVCSMYPELATRLPKKRQPWESEHYSLALFEAVALGVTFFQKRHRSA